MITVGLVKLLHKGIQKAATFTYSVEQVIGTGATGSANIPSVYCLFSLINRSHFAARKTNLHHKVNIPAFESKVQVCVLSIASFLT